MKKYYMAAVHNAVRILEAGDISFPITKADLLEVVGDKNIQIDLIRSSP